MKSETDGTTSPRWELLPDDTLELARVFARTGPTGRRVADLGRPVIASIDGEDYLIGLVLPLHLTGTETGYYLVGMDGHQQHVLVDTHLRGFGRADAVAPLAKDGTALPLDPTSDPIRLTWTNTKGETSAEFDTSNRAFAAFHQARWLRAIVHVTTAYPAVSNPVLLHNAIAKGELAAQQAVSSGRSQPTTPARGAGAAASVNPNTASR